MAVTAIFKGRFMLDRSAELLLVVTFDTGKIAFFFQQFLAKSYMRTMTVEAGLFDHDRLMHDAFRHLRFHIPVARKTK